MATAQGSMIVITGPPGAGKSTVARLVADSFDLSVLLVSDDFHHFIRRGYVPPWLAESQHQNEVVIDATAVSAVAYALGGYCVVVDGIIGPWFVERWLSHVPSELSVHYFVLCPTREIALKRAIERSGDTDLIDSGPVAFMHQVFTQRGGFGEHVLDSSRLTAEETSSEVIRLAAEGSRLLAR
jgi:predicted kinase